MRAMQLTKLKSPLQLVNIAIPKPHEHEVLIKISCCGVCRTDLHVVDGELPHINLPIIPGHQIVGRIVELGEGVVDIKVGDHVGVPWLGYSCGQCSYCVNDQENLCDHAKFTGYQINGGFAEYCVANARFCFPIPTHFSDLQAAPLLCAGLIGYRSLCKAGDAAHIGLYGFGAAAHLVIQVANYQNQNVYAFTRPGDEQAQAFAKQLNAKWAGSSDQDSPVKLDAAIIFAPVGELVPTALKQLKKGGIVVCAGIHMSDIPAFPYSILWGERTITSVANLTRADGIHFLKLASQIPIKTTIHSYSLEQANQALDDLRAGKFTGGGVIVMDEKHTTHCQ